MHADDVETLSVVEIIDPAQHLRISLEPLEKTATVLESDLGVRLSPVGPTQPSVRVKKTGEEELGASNLEGFAVIGKRFTTVIPAGRVGNDKSFNAVDEAWFSPDLQIVVRQTVEDPRNGTDVWKLTKIQTGEQDPALFEIPPDYKVVRR